LKDGYDYEVQRYNSINVLDQKLQLELFPYGSNTISTPALCKIFIQKPELITPYIEKLFDIIIQYPRKYILFGSRVYDTLFLLYDKNIKSIIEDKSPEKKFTGVTKKSLTFSYIKLNWKGHIIVAGIANSFPRRDLPNAYDKMEEYGRLSYEYYIQSIKK